VPIPIHFPQTRLDVRRDGPQANKLEYALVGGLGECRISDLISPKFSILSWKFLFNHNSMMARIWHDWDTGHPF
jgi:hypothetical protein